MTTRLTSKRNDGTVTRTAGRPILPREDTTMWHSIGEIRNAHTGHWFDESSMRFFASEIETGVIGGRYFVTSEDNFDRTERLYTVREATHSEDAGAEISTVGEFQAYATLADAVAAARAL